MPTGVVIAQATEAPNPILPGSSEVVWGALSVLLPLLIVVIVIVMIARYFGRLRRSAEEAAVRAGAAERQVAALRTELREQSA